MTSKLGTIKNLILILALVGSLSLTMLAYARIVEIERPKFTFFEEYLTLGDRQFLILSHGKCVGEVNIYTHKERATFVNIGATLRSSYKDKPISTSVKGQFYFNPIGQLSESTLNILTTNLELRAQSTNINPILIDTELIGLGDDKTFTLEFRGPVIITEYEPGKMRIEYSNQVQFANPIFEGPVDYLKSQNGLQIIEGKPEEHCDSGDNADRLPLDAVIKSLSKFSLKS